MPKVAEGDRIQSRCHRFSCLAFWEHTGLVWRHKMWVRINDSSGATWWWRYYGGATMVWIVIRFAETTTMQLWALLAVRVERRWRWFWQCNPGSRRRRCSECESAMVAKESRLLGYKIRKLQQIIIRFVEMAMRFRLTKEWIWNWARDVQAVSLKIVVQVSGNNKLWWL